MLRIGTMDCCAEEDVLQDLRDLDRPSAISAVRSNAAAASRPQADNTDRSSRSAHLHEWHGKKCLDHQCIYNVEEEGTH